MKNDPQIIYQNGRPHGIRDDTGFLFFFAVIVKYPGQEDRYRQEVEEQYRLAADLLVCVKARAREQSKEPQPAITKDRLSDLGDSLQIPPSSKSAGQ